MAPPLGPGLNLVGTLVAMLNVGLLVALLVLFGQAYRRMKTPFGLALLLFVVVLLVENVIRVLLVFERMGGTRLLPAPVALLGTDLLQTVALVVLLYLATR